MNLTSEDISIINKEKKSKDHEGTKKRNKLKEKSISNKINSKRDKQLDFLEKDDELELLDDESPLDPWIIEFLR